MFTKIKYFITIASLMFSITSYSDEFFDYYKYNDKNYRALTFTDWSQCIYSKLEDQIGEFIRYVSIDGLLILIKEKSFEKALQFIMKAIDLAVRMGIKKAIPFLTVTDMIYLSTSCAYLEWK